MWAMVYSRCSTEAITIIIPMSNNKEQVGRVLGPGKCVSALPRWVVTLIVLTLALSPVVLC